MALQMKITIDLRDDETFVGIRLYPESALEEQLLERFQAIAKPLEIKRIQNTGRLPNELLHHFLISPKTIA